MPKHFFYKFNEGPLSSVKELLGDWEIGNCRRAVQYYIYKKRKIFLKQEQVLCPNAYYNTGSFIMDQGQDFLPASLFDSDIIYAEKIRNKEGKIIKKNLETFSINDDYVISLHTALFTGEEGKEIWHATSIHGSSCYWSLEKFLYFYKPIAVKRV